MSGMIKEVGKDHYHLVFDLGSITDPVTGKRKRRQKYVVFRGGKKEAKDKLKELTLAVKHDKFVDASKLTLIDYLRAWLEKSIKPPRRRPQTYNVYRSVIELHIAKATIANTWLQRLTSSDLEHYYAHLKLKPSSVKVHHAALHSALRKAVKDMMLRSNPAVDLERPKLAKEHHRQGAQEHCWSAEEARRFLKATEAASPQLAAFYALALDSGARKNELHGLLWTDVTLDTATLTINKQLDSAGVVPVFGPTKTGEGRTVVLGSETVRRLRTHKKAQAELKMKNRSVYQDHGLVFAKEHEDVQRPKDGLGQPIKTLGGSRFRTLTRQAGVPPIKFHGLRHTCITLLLEAGEPVHVVANRVGHTKPSMTLDVYAHASSGAQQGAAARLGAVLFGS